PLSWAADRNRASSATALACPLMTEAARCTGLSQCFSIRASTENQGPCTLLAGDRTVSSPARTACAAKPHQGWQCQVPRSSGATGRREPPERHTAGGHSCAKTRYAAPDRACGRSEEHT